MCRLALLLLSVFFITTNLPGQETRPRSLPTKELTSGLQRIPNVAADLSTTDSYICQIVVTNISASTATFDIYDKQSTAKYLIKGASVLANQTYILNIPFCAKMTAGISWVASAANAFDAEVYGYKR